MFLPRSFATFQRSASRLQIRVRSLESWFVSALCASGFSQLKCPQKSLVRSTSHPLFFFSVVQKPILPLKRFRFPVVRLIGGVWQALCLLATSWRKRPCWGTRCSPNPPGKPGSKRNRFEPEKRLEMCPFRSLFLARSSRFFRRWRRKKWPFMRLIFPVFDPEKWGLHKNETVKIGWVMIAYMLSCIYEDESYIWVY